MRLLVVIGALLCSVLVYSQETTIVRVKGLVTSTSGKLMEDVQIYNKTAHRYTLTNERGEFFTGVKLNDTLSFSYVGYKNSVLIISQNYLDEKQLAVTLAPTVEQLADVVVEKETIDEKSLGIVKEKIKPLTKNERAVFTAKHMGRFMDMFGGMAIKVPTDPLINWISGRTKELKKRVILDADKKSVKALYTKFYTYVTQSLQVKEDDVMLFMYYLVDTGKEEQLLTAETNLAELYITEALIEFNKQRSISAK